MSAEAQGIGNRNVQIGLDGRVGRVVQVTFWVGLVQSDGGRDDAVVQCHHTNNQFDGTSSTKSMTHFRLRGTDVSLVGFIAHRTLDGTTPGPYSC